MSSNAGSQTPSSSPQAGTTPSQGTTSLSSSQHASPSSSSADSSSTPLVVSSSPPTTAVSSTTSTPTSTPPTTTTPQTSPQQSTAPVQSTTTTPAGATSPSSSPASTSSTTPVVFSTSSYTTQITSTYSTTNSLGSVVYVTTTIPDTVTTVVSTSPSSTTSSNSHIGVIVGAVVGGVGGIAIIILLLFCIRRRSRKDEFDGNFDPDRVVGHTGGGGTLPHVDLAEEVTPFPHPYATDGENSTMRQYAGSSYHAIPPFSASGQTSTEYYPSSKAAAAGTVNQSQAYGPPHVGSPPSSAYLPTDMYGTGSVSWSDPGVSPPPSTISHTTSSARGAKEREAMGRSGQGAGLTLATQQEAAEGSEDVVVHQDAGRAPVEDHPPPTEIPPAYESIRHD